METVIYVKKTAETNRKVEIVGNQVNQKQRKTNICSESRVGGTCK